MDLRQVLASFAQAIHRPADFPLEDLYGLIDALEGAPGTEPSVAPAPAPSADPMPEPDTPAVFPAAPEPFGTEAQPGA